MVEGALYDWKAKEVSIRVDNDPEVRLEVISALAEACRNVRIDMLSDS